MDSSSAGLRVPHGLTQPTEKDFITDYCLFPKKIETIILHSLHRSLYTADTIAVLVLFLLYRKLVQLPGVMIEGSAFVGHSGIF